jgi:hypothetical protein
LFGETGVGKSTWINSIANYLHFDSLKDAMDSAPLCLIPSQFTMTDKDYKPHTVSFGMSDGNSCEETLENSNSVTTKPKAYIFDTPKHRIRFIDTPGFNNTAGHEIDHQNFETIMKEIKKLDNLHGVILMLQSNRDRLAPTFKVTVTELLLRLPQSITGNFFFVMTNSRVTNYLPGDAIGILNGVINELGLKQNIRLKLDNSTIYMFDNEAIRFLFAHKAGVDFNGEVEAFTHSWQKSSEETRRLIARITQ